MLRPILSGFMLFVSCCQGSKSTSVETFVSGEVRELKGDFMPSPGVKIDLSGLPVQTTVVFTAAVNASENNTLPVFSQLPLASVKETRTDEQGRFRVKLKPGKYSVFVKVKEGWYANLIQDGMIHPVTVFAGKETKVSIKITLEATF